MSLQALRALTRWGPINNPLLLLSSSRNVTKLSFAVKMRSSGADFDTVTSLATTLYFACIISLIWIICQ